MKQPSGLKRKCVQCHKWTENGIENMEGFVFCNFDCLCSWANYERKVSFTCHHCNQDITADDQIIILCNSCYLDEFDV